MLSTMQNVPLSIARILEYGSTVHASTKVTTWRTDSAEESTFADIRARAAAFAHALHDELGITGDQRVGSFLYNCAEHLEVQFAAACKGAVFTPLNKQLMTDQIRHIINHAEVEVIVADPRLAASLGKALIDCPTVRAVAFTGLPLLTELAELLPDGIDVYSYESLLDGRATRYDWPVLDENTAAAICYSTGTSGAPKGVAYSHRSIYLQAMALRTTDSLAVSNGESFLCCVPIYHVLSWGVPFAAFMSGTPLVFPDSDVSAPTLARLIAAVHPRVATGVPTLWIQLMVHYLHNPPERMSLTELYVGGSQAPPILIKLWEERYGVDVVHLWGMTETSSVGTIARPPSGSSGEARWAYRISQGRFSNLLEYRVVNDGHVVSSTDRNQGEIQVRGNIVTGSYYHSPAEEDHGAASRFRGKEVDDAEQLFTADGWLRTGDVGSVSADGFLTVSDRARDVIRSGGEWIYSAMLENLVMDAAEVVESAVIGYPDDKWGERPLAVTVLHSDVEPTEETAEKLRERLRSSLPGWMLPEYWTFVKDIDKTSVGKFDKKDLRKHLEQGEFEIIKLTGPGEKRITSPEN
ncbi:Long-chain-fatty-acid--CoA ligase [Corynebacterium atrinae]|uniref:Acyl-CoA synthetase (AMP-forming)/AMP-acid ligase II n=1 Tax=Corynebacterium testudinoris TaxID=136857 RepID=A0A0G3H517_9CORY|nr:MULTISPECIES: long-chain fatty-acid--CoA ligase [Corynebacterium]AKK08506.1 acyl-CoA synthetase (AMP-forming)/AMP-acid ligase II [Corynebacterium testudinoris]MBX8994716.1 long-chain fatty-acid--CoA ligase [Corynebacterium testudinoris]WJY63138.1 Long-chain-fatty-acid--CoA ligase [Corynebacterium atrinae]